MGDRSRPTARMRLSGESVKVEKYEKALMFSEEHEGLFDHGGVTLAVLSSSREGGDPFTLASRKEPRR